MSDDDITKNWPAGVKQITFDAMDMLGFHENTHELYWNGHKLVTEKRFSNFERGLAIAGLAIAGIGVAATVVQAVAAVLWHS